MAYGSRTGRRPVEYASKASHLHVANSATVKEFLGECVLPKRAVEVAFGVGRLGTLAEKVDEPIRHVVAIDGGYREIPVQAEFPSATVAFFQFGVLMFSIRDLEQMAHQPFIDPADMAKLKEIQRFELTLPVKNVALKTEKSLTHSVRRAIYAFMRDKVEGGLDTLTWLVFEEFRERRQDKETLSQCPHCEGKSITLWRNKMSRAHTFTCPQCGGEILLTDLFRLHEAIDDDLGAGGVLGYVVTTIEQVLLAGVLRMMLSLKPGMLGEVFFIKDGPLGFFGQTANLHKPMRALCNMLRDKHGLYLAGLEKSGAFVEHAAEIASKLMPGQFLMLDNEHIYQYIIPGQGDKERPYGSSSYYGAKVIFRSRDGRMYVVTMPTPEAKVTPLETDYANLHGVLSNVEKLRCDMYDDALFPVALVNKLVSLADHPSSRILQRFSRAAMGQ